MVLARYNCDPDVLARAIHQFPRKKIIVLGDVMLDRFIWGSVSRISPEAPVPVVEIKTETICLGGAANVTANIRSLGGHVLPLGVLGDDPEGRMLRQEFRSIDTPVGGLIIDKHRTTSIKTRIIAHHQQVCRTDREDKSPLSERAQERIVSRFGDYLRTADGVIISDYAKGVISQQILKRVLPMARSAKKIVCVDPKLKDLRAYRPATLITPNTFEAEQASGIPIAGHKDLVRAGKKILNDSGIEHLLVTRGEEGMALFEGSSKVTYIPTVAREVFDVTGAGDTVISTICLGLVTGLSMLESAVLANIAAGIVVGKLGTASVTPDELIRTIREI